MTTWSEDESSVAAETIIPEAADGNMSRFAMISRSALLGLAATFFLLGIYLWVLTGVSGWDFAVSQFAEFRYFIISLALGFGVQVGLFSYLRRAIRGHCASGKVIAVSGTTSTTAVISCCAHYLTNILPVAGAAGLITLASQYQHDGGKK